jgi:hypothetical protein
MSARRRGFLRGLIAAPAVIRSPGLLMAIRPLKFDAAAEYVATGDWTEWEVLQFKIAWRAILPMTKISVFARGQRGI